MKRFAWLLVAAWIWLLVVFSAAAASMNAEQQAVADDFSPVSDKPLSPVFSGRTLPMYLQDDPQWAHIEYAGGTIGDSACGLCCAAMAIEYITTQRADPRTLSDAVGDTCLSGGVDDPGKFCSYMQTAYPGYGIESSGIYCDPDKALSDLDAGRLVFASVFGRIGDSEYQGHIVLLWRFDERGVWMRDPASGSNSQEPVELEQFERVNWVYFYSIEGGNYA